MQILFLLFALISMSTAHARADVSLRNGNFYASFRDISYPGGMEPKIERVYNSKSDYRGIFGYGWGSEYETRLRVDPDGSIVIADAGGGADNRFISKNYKTTDMESGVKQLVEAAKKAGLVASAKQVQEYQSKLMNDADFRSRQYGVFVGKGLVSPKPVANGTQFTSTRYLYQYVTKVQGGYVRVLEGGIIQKFNEAGKLVQWMDRNKNFINFSYDKNGRMVQLIDNQNRKMNLSYNQLNLVERVVGESGKTALFKYGTDNMLSYSRDDAGIENTFKYTHDKYLNLTEIGYLNKKDAKGNPKKMIIHYYGPDKFESVKSVTNPDGTTNEYEYTMDPKNPQYYAVRILVKDPGGIKVSDSKYEYLSKPKANGEEFVQKMIQTVDGEKTETTYDERLGFPVKITANGRTTSMEYDLKGRMTKKVTPIETTKLEYDPVVGKVSKVTRQMKSGTILWSTFEYDKATGNLILAKNSDKKAVKLVHDQQGRIRALIDQTGRQLTFKWNELSKPIEIADAKLGVVKFTYKNSGEVDKVESNGGTNVATEVMRALQGLIDITAPAGVTMSL